MYGASSNLELLGVCIVSFMHAYLSSSFFLIYSSPHLAHLALIRLQPCRLLVLMIKWVKIKTPRRTTKIHAAGIFPLPNAGLLIMLSYPKKSSTPLCACTQGVIGLASHRILTSVIPS